MLGGFQDRGITVHLTDLYTDPVGMNAKQGWVFYHASVPAASIEMHNQSIGLLHFSAQDLTADIDWKNRFKAYLDQTSAQWIELLNAYQIPNEKNQMVQLSSFASFQISNIQYVD